MFQYFKKQLHEGDTIGILFQGKEYYGKVLEKGDAQVNDYSVTIETDEGLRMLFPVTPRELAFIIPAKEEVGDDTSDSGDDQDGLDSVIDPPDPSEAKGLPESKKGPHEPKD